MKTLGPFCNKEWKTSIVKKVYAHSFSPEEWSWKHRKSGDLRSMTLLYQHHLGARGGLGSHLHSQEPFLYQATPEW